jgi:hypothetical protein
MLIFEGGVMEDQLIDSQYIADLYSAFQDLLEARVLAQNAMIADLGKYDVIVKNTATIEQKHAPEDARKNAIFSILEIYKGSQSAVDAGLLCASEETVGAINRLNEAKQHFKAAVMTFRDKYEKKSKLPGKHITYLIRDQYKDHGFRSDFLQKAMSTAGIGELDLKKCYTEIRVMPQNLDVFCWTWATKHSRLKKVSLTEAQKKVEEHFKGNADALDINLRYLSECRDSETLIERVKLKNQLRANYAFVLDGEIIRSSCPISGVVIVQGKELPRYVWRDNPEVTKVETPQVNRVSKIDSHPLIPQLGLYRYAQ